MKKIDSLEYSTLIWFLIRACFAEVTFTNLLYIVKQDSWISVVIGSILGLIPLAIFEYLKQKYPNETLITLNEKILGKFGKILNFIILIGCLIISTCIFWILVHFANSLFLYKTSIWIISLAFIIPIGYASSKDIHVIGKISLMLFYISILFSIIITIGLTGSTDISNVKPILESRLGKTFIGSLIFVALNTSKIFFLSIIPKNKIINYSSKKSILLYIFTCLTLVQITITTTCIFGIDLSTLYEYPAFQILKRVNILGVLDRIESILSIEALFSLFIQIIIIIYYAKEIINSLFLPKEKTNKYVITSICLLIFIISNIVFLTHESGEKFFNSKLIYIMYIVCIFIPIITFVKSLKEIKIIKNKHYNTSYNC